LDLLKIQGISYDFDIF
jgi:hypothetical protein